MIIRELVIYGYGQFVSRRIVLEEGREVLFYGKNEAGKSTIMSFIHSILFGLPSKQQADSKYEPKSSEIFGGAIIAEVPGTGRVKIERVRGKSGGEAVIELPGGGSAGEKLLREWTGGMDRTFYQSVFSFDLHGLQQIEKLNEEEIGKFLYVTSMVGTDTVYKLEQRLAKEQERLFKPNGKKPVLNDQLGRLKRTADAAGAAAQRERDYQPLLQQEGEIQTGIQEIEERLKYLREQQSFLSKAISCLPLLNEQRNLKQELATMPDTSLFPADGTNRIDRLKSEIEPLSVQAQRLAEQIRLLTDKASSLKPDYEILENKSEIESLKGQSAEYQALEKERNALAADIQRMTAELTELADQVYESPPHQEKLASIDTTIKMKSAISDALEASKTLSLQKKQLDEQFDRAREAIDLSEARYASLAGKTMGKEVRLQLEQELSTFEKDHNPLNAEQLKREIVSLEKEMESQKKKSGNLQKNFTALFVMLTILLGAGMIWSVIQQQWMITGILTAILLLSGVLIRLHNRGSRSLMEHLHERKSVLEGELEKTKDSSPRSLQRAEEIRGLLWKDEQIKQMADLEKLRTEQEERACDRIIARFEEWEKDRFQLEESLNPIRRALMLEEGAGTSSLAESIGMIERYKQIYSEKQRKEELYRAAQAAAEQFEHQAQSLLRLGNARGRNLTDAIEEAHSAMLAENGKAVQIIHIEARLEEVNADYQERLLQLNGKKEEYYNLLKTAQVHDEEAFRIMAVHHQERREAEKKLLWTERQLEASDIAQQLAGRDWLLLEDELRKTRIDAESAEQSLKEKREQASHLKAKLRSLEADGSYSDHLHELEVQKEEARQTARDWAVRTLARDFLQRTIQYYRTVRMPKLLERTVYFFGKLTKGRYVNVYLPEREQTFIAERIDGQRFKAGELSQATSEQLYVSLRLALINSLNETLNLPVLIDDGFVHFDGERTSQMLKTLHELSAGQQVLIFTCHEQLAEEFAGGVHVLERDAMDQKRIEKTV
ncbi:AAA family ATPase [Metabacillus sp. 113a]|uniref:ATP-binding protein n=1 Tax=Metabacillus sp. 113a TaxID=3404706 RepID=UPI003CF6B58D